MNINHQTLCSCAECRSGIVITGAYGGHQGTPYGPRGVLDRQLAAWAAELEALRLRQRLGTPEYMAPEHPRPAPPRRPRVAPASRPPWSAALRTFARESRAER